MAHPGHVHAVVALDRERHERIHGEVEPPRVLRPQRRQIGRRDVLGGDVLGGGGSGKEDLLIALIDQHLAAQLDEIDKVGDSQDPVQMREQFESRVERLMTGLTDPNIPQRQTNLIRSPANGLLPPLTAEGKRRRIERGGFATRREAQKALEEVVAKADRGGILGSSGRGSGRPVVSLGPAARRSPARGSLSLADPRVARVRCGACGAYAASHVVIRTARAKVSATTSLDPAARNALAQASSVAPVV